MVRVLLVANKTLGSGEVSDYVRNRMAKDECQFTLLVPATPRADREPASRLAGGLAGASQGVGSSGSAEDTYAYARTRLEYGLDVFRRLGADVDGDIGDSDPAKAIQEVLQRKQFDEVALSQLPKAVSRWLRLDIPHQIERKFSVPVTVIKVQNS